ncbi:MAG: hypothetical protein PHY12_01845 [Eubacteriales bacterium]|nr:hypothetical protein [Eubacteriales bacterium]
MPRGVKGSGKPKTTARKTVKKAEEVKMEPQNVETKGRKAYPSHAERIAMAEKQIERLNKLNASREALVAKTQKTLDERKEALEKSRAMLAKQIAKKERLTENVMSSEEKAVRKAEKKAEAEKLAMLNALLKEKGKSIDELLAEIQ